MRTNKKYFYLGDPIWEAFRLARKAYQLEEVPVGAIVLGKT